MTRRHNVRGTRPAPRYKWLGFGVLRTPETSSSTSVSEVIQMAACLVDSDVMGDVTLEAFYLHLSIQRILVTGFDALGYIVVNQKCALATGNPIEVLNPLALSTGTADAELGSRDILMQGLLPCPGTAQVGDSAAQTTDGSLQIAEVHYKARRRVHRLTHGIYLHITSDVSAVTRVFASGRVLFRYA